MSIPAQDIAVGVVGNRTRTLWWAVAVAAMCVAVIGLLWPSLPAVHRLWTRGFTYTHGYLVLVAASYLAFDILSARRKELAIRTMWLGILPIAVIVFAFVVSRQIGIDIVQQALMPAIAWLVVLTLFGWAIAAALVPVFGLVYFAIPLWDQLIIPLQNLTTIAVGFALQLHEFPVLISGFHVSVPAGEFQIAGGCSGLHFLIVGLTISFVVSVLDRLTWKQSARVLLATAVVATLVNWIRVYSLIVVGQYSAMQHYLITTDHYVYGWVLFAIATALLAFFYRRWMPEAIVEQAIHRARRNDSQYALSLAAPIAISVIMVLGIVGEGLLTPTKTTTNAAVVPVVNSQWSIEVAPGSPWQPVQSDNAITSAGYASNVGIGVKVEWFVAYYPWQANNQEVRAWGNRPWNPGWQAVSQERSYGAHRYTVATVRTASGGYRLVAWVERVASEPVFSRLDAKVNQLLGLVRGNSTAEFAAISQPCVGDCSDEYPVFGQASESWFSALVVTPEERVEAE